MDDKDREFVENMETFAGVLGKHGLEKLIWDCGDVQSTTKICEHLRRLLALLDAQIIEVRQVNEVCDRYWTARQNAEAEVARLTAEVERLRSRLEYHGLPTHDALKETK